MRPRPRIPATPACIARPPGRILDLAEEQRQQVLDEGAFARSSGAVDQQRAAVATTGHRALGGRPCVVLAEGQEAGSGRCQGHAAEYMRGAGSCPEDPQSVR